MSIHIEDGNAPEQEEQTSEEKQDMEFGADPESSDFGSDEENSGNDPDLTDRPETEEISNEENASDPQGTSGQKEIPEEQEDSGCGEAARDGCGDAADSSDEFAGDGGNEEGGSADTSAEAGQPERRRFFGRKDKRDKRDREIEELKTKVSDLTDRVKRDLAEFDNYRKRTDKEKAAMFDMGAKSMIEKILPMIDNFERGLAAVPEDQKEDPFVAGMDKVYKQLMKDLNDAGLAPIEAVGAPFDPNLHNAVMHVEDENLSENVVAQEFQKGYTYKGSVVRHSMVQVAN